MRGSRLIVDESVRVTGRVGVAPGQGAIARRAAGDLAQARAGLQRTLDGGDSAPGAVALVSDERVEARANYLESSSNGAVTSCRARYRSGDPVIGAEGGVAGDLDRVPPGAVLLAGDEWQDAGRSREGAAGGTVARRRAGDRPGYCLASRCQAIERRDGLRVPPRAVRLVEGVAQGLASSDVGPDNGAVTRRGA